MDTNRVVVPDSLNPDPNKDPGFWWPKLETKYSWNFFLYCFWSKNCNLLSPRPPERTSKMQKKPSALKRTSSPSKLEISKFFLLLWVIFALLDPDTDPLTWLNPDMNPPTWLNPDTDPLTWSNPDMDPPTWLNPDTDPLTWSNPDRIRIRIRNTDFNLRYHLSRRDRPVGGGQRQRDGGLPAHQPARQEYSQECARHSVPRTPTLLRQVVIHVIRVKIIYFGSVLGIRIRNCIWIRRIRMFLGLPDPDPLFRVTDPDLAPDPSLFP